MGRRGVILFYAVRRISFQGYCFYYSGHDMKADINRRCNPSFNVNSVVSKKEKLKEINADVEDFFKKIFVVDAKKRITFANIIKHPLFRDHGK